MDNNLSNKKLNVKVFAAVTLVTVIAIPTLIFASYKSYVNKPILLSQPTYFEIKEGASVTETAKNLKQQGLIKSPFVFKLYLVENNLESNIQAGVYTIPQSISIAQLAEIFQHGTNDVSVTFVEGWRIEEFAAEAAQKLPSIDNQVFISLAKDHEGYLFPDTYFFSRDISEKEILDRLLENFNIKTIEVLSEQNLKKAGLTKNEAIIFASIVEREVFNEEDRKIVAGILINRWKNGELIGADATTQYAIATESDWWPENLTLADLATNSPYNTRKSVGLPPTPISNPGLASIQAVINKQQTNYNFYLTDANGVTHYATTLEEHNKNVIDFLSPQL